MSRRRDRGIARDAKREAPSAGREARGAEGGGREAARGVPGAWAPGAPAPHRRPPTIPFIAQAGVLTAVFAITTLIAELAGAANLGVSIGIASIAFSIALVLVIVRT